MQFLLPRGVKSGQSLQILNPFDKSGSDIFTVIVPDGVQPGTQLEVIIPPLQAGGSNDTADISGSGNSGPQVQRQCVESKRCYLWISIVTDRLGV